MFFPPRASEIPTGPNGSLAARPRPARSSWRCCSAAQPLACCSDAMRSGMELEMMQQRWGGKELLGKQAEIPMEMSGVFLFFWGGERGESHRKIHGHDMIFIDLDD